MKIAIAGKGGVGKTTLAAAMAWLLAQGGEGHPRKKVLAIDADPTPSLALSLGIKLPADLVPVCEMRELIKERTGVTSEGYGVFFKLNPHVADIPEKFWVERDGVKLIILGAVQKGGGGCACPENVFLKNLLSHLILQRDEVAVVDMEAGVEHLGRATVKGVNALIIVVEPSLPSLETAHKIRRLASEIGIKRVFAVGNKVMRIEQIRFLEEGLKDIPLLGCLSYNPKVQEAAFKGKATFEDNETLIKETRDILKKLQEALLQ
ncbi:MAG TPA: nucleotide-binding protein [Candidatus Hypogeohydataceae bacterium YC41]